MMKTILAALVLAGGPRASRRAIVPTCALLPGVFERAVRTLAH